MNVESWPISSALAQAAERLEAQTAELVDLCIQIQQIPGPTGAEAQRAAWVEARFREIALHDVVQDDLYNVYGRIPGQGSGPALLISAHTDTVFPTETDLTVDQRPEEGRIYGPGLGDNSTGVAGLLALIPHLQSLQPPVDIWLVANSNEEGLGDLKGMRAAVDRLQDQIGACIVLEGMGVGRLVHQGLGSYRLRVTAQAPGGHSWGDFGAASAIHVLVALAADLARLTVPVIPRTTYNIGRIRGGTSVNTIAENASLELDMRSAEPSALEALVGQALAVIARHQAAHRLTPGVEIRCTVIGDRPAGQIPADHFLVQAAQAALLHSGFDPEMEHRMSSTDANVPLSRHIPAICVGLLEGGNAHRLTEWIDPTALGRGMKQLLLLSWWTALWLQKGGVCDA